MPVDAKICAICLEDHSDPNMNNEIVACDGCGIMVHEVCYGILDTVYSEKSKKNAENGTKNEDDTESSLKADSIDDSIELWFCDECKNSLSHRKSPHSCELCPLTNVGPLKETDGGQWVHMVCALHTPGVQFYSTDLMNCITLSELAYLHWSEKECELCFDHEKRISGYTVKCFHKNCSKYFHCTCAQLKGLTFQPAGEDPVPFLILCEDHISNEYNDKYIRNYKNVEILHNALKLNDSYFNDDANIQFAITQLPFFARKYAQMKSKWPSAWIPENKYSKPIQANYQFAMNFKAKNQKLKLFDTVLNDKESQTLYAQEKSLTDDIDPNMLFSYIEKMEKIQHDGNSIDPDLNNLNIFLSKNFDSRITFQSKYRRRENDMMTKIRNIINNNDILYENLPEDMRDLSSEHLYKIIFNSEKKKCWVCDIPSPKPLMIPCQSCFSRFGHLSCQKVNETIPNMCQNCQLNRQAVSVAP